MRGKYIERGVMEIKTPLVIMFEDERTNNVICHLHPSETCCTYRYYGLLTCDLARHVAKCFDAEEEQVWEWVDKERKKPTTDVIRKH
jgi:hypothetical protein